MRKVLVALALMCTVLVVACGKKNTTNTDETTTKKKQPIKQEEQVKESIYNLSIDGSFADLDDSYDISETLYGLFLEDINFAVDGGMYAEMIKNRSFEYGKLATNGGKHGYKLSNNTDVVFEVVDGAADNTALNANNTHYAIVENKGNEFQGIYNRGFLDGLSVEENAEYKFTIFLKALDGYKGAVKIALKDGKGNEIAVGTIDSIKNEWWKYEVNLKANATVTKALSCYVMIENGKVAMDMVSLFPVDTYNGRENGLRKEIVEYLQALNPKFLRFPGGCVIEGKTLESAYSWKDSIGDGLKFKINGVETTGDVAARPLGIDIWADLNRATEHPYYMTYGVGFYEYFLLCEDLNCMPVPILNAGMTCPIQSPQYTVVPTNSEEFQQYIQDALDLVEFCLGGPDTKWGAVRIAMGHEDTFQLKYVGIGNEQWQDEYYVHYGLFKEAFEKAAKERPEIYGDIELIVANGPASGDRFGWNKVKQNGSDYAGLVDEHYYQTPDWFLANVHRYDKYDRNSVPVFLGEYAAKSNNWRAALAEAAYMTGIEANADIVKMACYAPLFGNTTQTQWTPDLIWFNNNKVWGSVNYYVQQIFAQNVGTKMLKADLKEVQSGSSGLRGKIGIGSWSTSATFDNLKVVSNDDKSVLFEETFDDASVMSDYSVNGGKFSIVNGTMKQTNTAGPANDVTGDTAFVGDVNWKNYTYTLEATKNGGSEGFLIPIAAIDKDNFIFWNIGGWNNTVSCLQIVSNGSKSDQVEGTVSDFTIQTGKKYEIKIIVEDSKIRCFINNTKLIDYNYTATEEVFQSTSIDEESGDMIIKLVNVGNKEVSMNFDITNFDNMNTTADVTSLSAKNAAVTNTATSPDNVAPVKSTLTVSEKFTYKLQPLSVVVIRIHNK